MFSVAYFLFLHFFGNGACGAPPPFSKVSSFLVILSQPRLSSSSYRDPFFSFRRFPHSRNSPYFWVTPFLLNSSGFLVLPSSFPLNPCPLLSALYRSLLPPSSSGRPFQVASLSAFLDCLSSATILGSFFCLLRSCLVFPPFFPRRL